MRSFSRFPAALVLLGFLSACGGSDEPTAPQVASVEVSPGSSTLSAIGASVQLTATARDASGKVVSGQSVSWSSSDASVASVSTSGLVTAVAPGTAAVTARVQGVAGSAVITVTEPPASCSDPLQISLSAGQYEVLDAQSCFVLPSGASGDRYRVAVTRPTEVENASDVVDMTLSVTGLGISGAPPAPASAPGLRRGMAPIPGLNPEALRRSIAVAEATEAFHRQLREREAAMVQALGGRGFLPTARPDLRLRTPQRAASPQKIQIDPATPSDCKTGAGNLVTGILIGENDDLAIYQDSAQNATSPLTAGEAQEMTHYYTAYAKDMIRDYFGEVPDIDNNGKVVVFASPVVTGQTAAFVWSGDFYSKEACPASNEKELIFFSSSLIQNMGKADPTWQALETLAHEMKHVVSLYNRIAASIAANASRFHPSWIEEGTAEIAGEMSSRIAWAATGGPAVGAQVTLNDFANSGDRPTKENYGVLLRMARTVWYLASQPNGLVVSPNGAMEGNSIYGSGWHFHRWLGDAYGNAATPMGDAPFFHALNDSTAGMGTQGLLEQTGKTFHELFEEFVVAVNLHGTGAPPFERGFATYDFITATDVLVDQPTGTYPWPVTTTASGPSASFQTAEFTGKIGPSGIRIHDFVSNGTGTGAQISVDMNAPGKIIVVRIR